MNYTPNYNLKLPERNEQFNLDDWNSNTMAIDSQMKTNATNIATNTTDIATLLTNLTTNKSNDTSSTYFKLMKLIYPVGSIYWSNNSANPSTLFGGTWTQIKDKFVWAKGDSDTVGATGGAKTVTLITDNLPSHSHTIGGSTGNTQPTFTGTKGTTSANNRGHTHSVTASGSISGGVYSFSGTSVAHSHKLYSINNATSWGTTVGAKDTNAGGVVFGGSNTSSTNSVWISTNKLSGTKPIIENTNITPTGTISVTTNPTFTGSAVTSSAESQNHTHTITPSGTVQNHNHSLPANTGSTGSAIAINKMPPYIVKYCWERTA